MIEDGSNFQYENIYQDFTPVAKHKFEIPFNGDFHLLDLLHDDKVLRDYVKFIYMPCNPVHGVTTSPDDRPNDFTLQQTDQIIKVIQDMGFEPCILIQRGDDINGLSYYKERGCKYFTIGDDNLARKARDKYGDDIYLTASITKLIPPEEYMKGFEEGLYDVYLLNYYFNRHIEDLKKLPTTSKYSLMVNCTCLWNCPQFKNHWFPDIEGPRDNECIYGRFSIDKKHVLFENVALICPEDLPFFDDYVDCYKIVDRLYTTPAIMHWFNWYVYGVENISQETGIEKGEAKYQID